MFVLLPLFLLLVLMPFAAIFVLRCLVPTLEGQDECIAGCGKSIIFFGLVLFLLKALFGNPWELSMVFFSLISEIYTGFVMIQYARRRERRLRPTDPILPLRAEEPQEPADLDEAEALMETLKDLVYRSYIINDQRRRDNLVTIAIYIKEAKANGSTLSPSTLRQVRGLLEDYSELKRVASPTGRHLEIIRKMESTLDELEVATRNLYEGSCEAKLNDVESSLEALELRLRLEGLVDDSPFRADPPTGEE